MEWKETLARLAAPENEARFEALTQELARRGLSYELPVSYTHLDVYKRQSTHRRRSRN